MEGLLSTGPTTFSLEKAPLIKFHKFIIFWQKDSPLAGMTSFMLNIIVVYACLNCTETKIHVIFNPEKNLNVTKGFTGGDKSPPKVSQVKF